MRTRVVVGAIVLGVAIAIAIASTQYFSPAKQPTQSVNAELASPAQTGESPARNTDSTVPVAPSRSVSSATNVGVTPAAPTTDPEGACRDRLASRGIYLQTGNPCLDIDAVINRLAIGTYKFNKPETAYVDEPFSVFLALKTAEDQDLSSVFAGTAGQVVEKQGRFAQHLTATLRGGSDFKVEPSGAQERTVTSLLPVLWEWTVTPLNRGTKTMVIEVAANLVLGSQNERVQIRTLQEPIEVRVGVFHLVYATLSNAWGIALGAVSMIGAILGIIHHLSRIRRQRRRAGK